MYHFFPKKARTQDTKTVIPENSFLDLADEYYHALSRLSGRLAGSEVIRRRAGMVPRRGERAEE